MRVSRGLGSQVLFLSPLTAAGGLVLFLSQIFAWVFLPQIDVRGLSEWNGPLEQAHGRIVAVERTASRVNGRRVMKVGFEHGPHRGASYTTDPRGLAVGDPVEIEHPRGKPDRGRITGMAREPFPPWALLPLAPVLLAGIVLVVIGLAGGVRRLGILRRGEVTSGALVGRTPTNVRVNRKRVHRHHFRFTARDGRAGEAFGRSHHDLPATNSDIVYDPETLRAVVVAALPGRPTLDMNGDLQATRPRLALLVAALPVLGIAGWIAAVLISIM